MTGPRSESSPLRDGVGFYARRKDFPTGRHMDMYVQHQEEYWPTVCTFLKKHGCFDWN